MTQREIKWEKWADPLTTYTEDDKRIRQKLVGEQRNEDYEDEFDDGDLQEFYTNRFVQASTRGPVIVGPSGIIPLRESNSPGEVFRFWLGHSNFKLSNDDVEKIKEVNGVEAINVFTRHRFRVAIGKAFDEHLVMTEINGLFKQKKPAIKGLSLLTKRLDEKFNFWAVMRWPDGRLSSYGAKTQTEVNKFILTLKGRPEVCRSWG